jgi:predicted Na+-dependent transporter
MGFVWNARSGRQAGMFLKHVVPAVLKPARTLWNELIGFIFLCIATSFAVQAVRSAMQHQTGRTVLAGFCTFLLGMYGVGSFRRARKISRS